MGRTVMVGLPLSGVAHWSPLGSGGGDPAHPLALRLSEGAVGWAGPPPLSRTWMYLLKGPRGGISNATSFKCGGPPSPYGKTLVVHPSGYGRSAHRVPFARETAIDNFWVSGE